jgi:putative membrane protein insertion efficiency factor
MKLKQFSQKSISFYQKFLSPAQIFFKNSGCVFYPTCSEYAKQAILKYGVAKGIYLGTLRILRCHPWQKKHFDPVK